MLSVRGITRSAPRVASRISPSNPVLCKALTFRPSSQSTRGLTRIKFAPFSTSIVRKAKNAKNEDSEIVSKLASEIELEKEMSDNLEPTSVKDFLKNGPFEISDVPGKEEVVLTRKYGDEKIQISFSVSDINMDSNPEFNDRAFDDEEIGAENSEEQKNPEEDDLEDDESSLFPVRLNIIVEKPSKGAMVIEAGIQEGAIITDSVLYCKDTSHAYAKTPEAQHLRRDLYLGPPFHNLDENLQVLFERYLDERGINNALAVFVPEYINMKEQKEYVRWLENIKRFMS